MLYAVVAWMAAAACVWAGAARFRRVSRDDGAEQLVRSLRRADRAAALRVAEAAGAPPGAAAELLSEVLAAPTRAHAVAAVNERLADVSTELEGARDVPRAAARISIAAGTVVALVRLATGLGNDGPWLAWAIAAFAGGLFGAGWSMVLARLAERRARGRREAWNRLARAVMALLPETHDVSGH